MKNIQPYNALSGCLEPHFGGAPSEQPHPRREYREPEQGLRTVQFKSQPLQLNYMRRRNTRPLLRLPFGK